jgi:hypothetical protein
MTEYVPAILIKQLEEALNNSVPARRHNDVLAALKRCQELIGRLATTIVDLDREQKHGDLMFEAKLYANVLTGFFEGPGGEWFDLSKGYDPRDYLATKGIIKAAAASSRPVNETRVKMEEKFAADRKAKHDEINRILSDREWKRAQQKLKRAQRKLKKEIEAVTLPKIEVMPVHEYVNKLRAEHGLGPVKPASKRGRPIGSKNKPKVDVVPKAAVGPLYPNRLKRAKAKKGSPK